VCGIERFDGVEQPAGGGGEHGGGDGEYGDGGQRVGVSIEVGG
jgi:hypothetical protein